MNRTVVVLDNDLGFAFWLARALDCAGYEAFPAKTVSDALFLLRNLPSLQSNPRLLVVGGPGSGAQDLVDACRCYDKEVHFVCLLDECSSVLDPVGQCEEDWPKPAERTPEECAELLRVIGRVVALESVPS